MIRDLKNKLIITAALLIAASVLYLSGIGCVFRYFLHIVCPGCGMTRALLAAMRLDFAAAWKFHPMFWSLPILYICFLFDDKLLKCRIFNICLFSLIGAGFLINWIYSLFCTIIH